MVPYILTLNCRTENSEVFVVYIFVDVRILDIARTFLVSCMPRRFSSPFLLHVQNEYFDETAKNV
jgi:hypothetical protein